MPIAAAATLNCTGALRPAGVTTTAPAVPAATSYGNCALICPGVTAISGAAAPFTSTPVAPEKFEPKRDNSAPGAIGAVKLAALTIPPAAITGPGGIVSAGSFTAPT